MNISEAGLDLIKEFEGCVLHSYRDSIGVWTNGWGNTHMVEPREDALITQEQADSMLKRNLGVTVSDINRMLKVEVTQQEFDALCSLVHNIGSSALEKSTLMRLLNAGDHDGAAEQFTRWNRAGGKELAGLTRRRIAEQDMFKSENVA